jgi:hypothetical protein
VALLGMLGADDRRLLLGLARRLADPDAAAEMAA